MTERDPGSQGGEPPEKIPLGQKLLDSPFILLVICIVVMFVFYTGWGIVEYTSLDEAPLP
jgi:hypothetical protein